MFFLYWAMYGVVTGEAFVVQTVYRHEHPILFWIIGITWLALAVLTIIYDLFPQLAPDFAAAWLGATNG